MLWVLIQFIVHTKNAKTTAILLFSHMQNYTCVYAYIYGREVEVKGSLCWNFPNFSVCVNSEWKSRSLLPWILGQGSSLSSMTIGKNLYTNRGINVGLLELKIAKVVQCCDLEKGWEKSNSDFAIEAKYEFWFRK